MNGDTETCGLCLDRAVPFDCKEFREDAEARDEDKTRMSRSETGKDDKASGKWLCSSAFS